jgi:hypothetical protein
MIGDLPELGDIFNNKNDKTNKKNNKINKKNVKDQNDENKEKFLENDIYLFLSREEGKWFSVTFIDTAPSNIGLHVLLPVSIKFDATDLDNIILKIEKRQGENILFSKKIPVLIRWKEKDPISGKMKIGIHFPGETKTDPEITKLMQELLEVKK